MALGSIKCILTMHISLYIITSLLDMEFIHRHSGRFANSFLLSNRLIKGQKIVYPPGTLILSFLHRTSGPSQ